jgi:dipeptidase
MFHILPDDTGASAVWVARRVPDGHITAVANQFVITEIDFDDSANYLYSANIVAVAVRNNLWANHSTSSVISVNKGDGLRYNRPFNFLQVYGQNIHSSAYQATRRIWRVFTLASPSLLPVFSAYTDSLGSFGYGVNGTEPYPFSVQVDKLLSVRDVMAMNRDQYEGTPFDMSTGMDAGRFGDPVRFRPVSAATDPLLGVTVDQYNKGLMYNRAISIARTSYSTVTHSRGDVPDVLGALTWVAQYAPHHSSFVPVYAHCAKTPESLKNGTLRK